MTAEDFNLADVRTLILYAKALAAFEPDPAVGHHWQTWHDLRNEALAYVEALHSLAEPVAHGDAPIKKPVCPRCEGYDYRSPHSDNCPRDKWLDRPRTTLR